MASRWSTRTTGSSRDPGRSSARIYTASPAYGQVEQVSDGSGNAGRAGPDTKTLLGALRHSHCGYAQTTVNFLRLWRQVHRGVRPRRPSSGWLCSKRSGEGGGGNHLQGLYPNDKTENGRELRLVQQYFFVTCSLPDIIRRHRKQRQIPWDNFADKVAIQLTTRIRPSPSWSCCAILVDRRRSGRGSRPGRSSRGRSVTRITRCCRRHSNDGVWPCFSGSCRATSSSSLKSMRN